jgi:hypothetical protein
MLNGIMLNVANNISMLSVVMLNVVMHNVMVPIQPILGKARSTRKVLHSGRLRPY